MATPPPEPAAPPAHAPPAEPPASPPAPTAATQERDSITRDKERLQRFHKEAMSFLAKAYSNDDAVLVEDRFDSAAASARSSEDFLAQRRIDLDRLRLERFHAQAVSFLDRAYADEPGTIVEEEVLSPPASTAAAHDREMLQKFHREAMSFLDAAAGGASAQTDSTNSTGPDRTGSGLQNRRADRTSLRIERDKARLEQHYKDAMSFLDRAEAEKNDVLVEEQELELAVVDRFKLQKYAQDAMSFLDKAFRNDSSVMVGDDEDVDLSENDQYTGGSEQRKIDSELGFKDPHSQQRTAARQDGSNYAGAASSQEEEDRKIAADRAALERYDEEFGDFLSKAYLDDSTVIVEDADSETSGTERGLFARRMLPSTTSADTGDCSGSATLDEEFSEDAYTDDEFQDPTAAESSQLDVLRRSLPTETPMPSSGYPESSGDCVEDGDETLHSRMMRYEREAADYLDGTNVSVDDDDEVTLDEEGEAFPRLSENDCPGGAQIPLERGRSGDVREDETHVIVDEDEEDDEEFGADQFIDDESIPPAFYDDNGASESRQSSHSEFEVRSSQFPDRVDLPKPNSEKERAFPRSPDSQDLLVDVILEDQTGKSQALSQVPLERSFYRQIPRGSTIKLRPMASPQLSSSSRAETAGTNDSVERVPLSELQRVEKERDALMGTLEDIVNERSMLAAQVSELKSTMQNAGGAKADVSEVEDDTHVIDLAAELKDAHETMAKLTEEMEATLAVLDNRYQDTLERAHKAEEKCIRLESNASKLEKEFSMQGMRLSQSIAEESRLTSLLSKSDREVEMLKRKTENDVKRLDESHREELDRSVKKILDLTNQVSELQEKVKSSSGSAERKLNPEARKLELEIAGLKRRLGEMDRKLSDERANSRKKVENETQKAKLDKEREVQNLSIQVKRLEAEARDSETADRELRKAKSDAAKFSGRIRDLELAVEELQRSLKSAKRGQVTAEAEAQHVRTRYEESLKKRMSRIDQKAEMRELQVALDHMKEEAGGREKRLQRQLAELRSRAERAEATAAQAELDAKEAAEAAKIAQERGKVAIEAERKARKIAEAEKQIMAKECKEWEEFAQQQMDLNAKSDDSSSGLAKSSSRRGLRRSPSKGKDKDSARKRRDGKGVGASEEEGGKKKSSLRPRFFGGT